MNLTNNSKLQVMVLNQFVLVGISDDETKKLTEQNKEFMVSRLLCSLHNNLDEDNQIRGYTFVPEPVPMDLMTDSVELISQCLSYTNKAGILCYSEISLNDEKLDTSKLKIVEQFLKFWSIELPTNYKQ